MPLTRKVPLASCATVAHSLEKPVSCVRAEPSGLTGNDPTLQGPNGNDPGIASGLMPSGSANSPQFLVPQASPPPAFHGTPPDGTSVSIDDALRELDARAS